MLIVMKLNNLINKHKKNLCDISELSKTNFKSENIIKDLKIKNND